MLGAFFMATDYVTSLSCLPAGKVVFGIGCGLMTMIIRTLGPVSGRRILLPS